MPVIHILPRNIRDARNKPVIYDEANKVLSEWSIDALATKVQIFNSNRELIAAFVVDDIEKFAKDMMKEPVKEIKKWRSRTNLIKNK